MNTIWIFLILVIFLLAYLGQNEKTYAIFFRVFLSILLAYIVGFGGIAASDHAAYVRMYNDYYTSFMDLGEYVWSSLFRSGYEIESGYILLNILCHSIGLGEAGFFFVVALFVNGTTIRHIYKHNLPMLSVLSIFFISAFMSQQANLVRQFLALGVMMYFIDYLSDEKKWWKYLLGVILAAQFHASAYFFILFLPIMFVKSNKSKKNLRVVLLGLVFVSILIRIGLISSSFLNYFGFITAYEGRFTTLDMVSSNINNIPALMVTLPAIYILLKSNLYNKNIIYIVFISTAAIFVNMGFAYPNLRRMYWYFEPIAYVYLLQYLDLDKFSVPSQRSGVAVIKYVVIAMGVFFMLRNYIFNPNQLLLSTTYDWGLFFN